MHKDTSFDIFNSLFSVQQWKRRTSNQFIMIQQKMEQNTYYQKAISMDESINQYNTSYVGHR